MALPLGGVTPLGTDRGIRVPRGRRVLRTLEGADGGKFFLQVPAGWSPGGPVLIAIHGISREARQQIDLFAAHAALHRCALIAPWFRDDDYAGFQRLGLDGRGGRADRFLLRILAAFDELFECATPASARFLFGYSGGAQFAHRFALLHPGHCAALVLGAAGWYSFPDPAIAWPRGLAAWPGDRQPDLAAWLRLPMLVLVGRRDTERDEVLRTGRALNRQQGRHRLERARRFVGAVNAAADAAGCVAPARLEVLPGVGHSFIDAVTLGGLAERTFTFLGFPAPADSGESP